MSDEMPDFTGVVDAFRLLGSVLMGTLMGDMLEQHRAGIAEDIVDNVERGVAVTPE